MRIVLREKRQLTLPAEICDALGIKVGDSLEVEVKDGCLTARRALNSLEEIWRIMAESGVTEEELLQGGREIREELFRRDFPNLAKRKVG